MGTEQITDNELEEVAQDRPESSEVDIYADLDEVDREIVRVKLEKPNITNIDLAEMLGMHRQTLAKRLKKEKLQRQIIEAQKSALQILLEAQSEAARRLKMLMRDDNKDVSMKACKEVLKGVLSENMNLNVNLMGRKRLLDFMDAEDVDIVAEQLKDELGNEAED